MDKIVILTGGSSGIGLHTARYLASHGCRVYELSRSGEDAPGIVHIRTDVTDESQIKEAVDRVMKEAGRIDIVVNNAGFGISGAVEYTDTKDAQRQFDVNFFGTVRLNRAVLPVMHAQGFGRILNMSSVAASIPIPFQAFYSAAKAAVSSYSQALWNEVRPYGIEICAILPGDIATGFTSARAKNTEGDEAYGHRISRGVAVMEHDETHGIPAEAAGAFVGRLALGRKVPVLCTLGGKYRLFLFLTRLLPTGLLNRIVGMLYAS